MKNIIYLILPLFLWLETANEALSQDFEVLFRDFDASNLTYEDKRFLQTALAFEGHYHGLLDGAWGRISDRALNRYSQSEFETAPADWHMAMLAWSLFERLSNDGWEFNYFPGLGLSLLWPEKTIVRDADTDYFLNYSHKSSTLAISMGVHNRETTQKLHDFTLSTHEGATQPYSVRKQNLAVSSATDRDGSILYTRSDFVNGSWSTVMLSSSEQDAAILGAVSSSISAKRVQKLSFTIGGKLDYVVKTTIDALEQSDESQAKTAEVPPSNRKNVSGSAGSGFVVSAAGHVLTNAHVVEGCTTITVDGRNAKLVAFSQEFDLALLVSEAFENKEVAVFSASSAKLNSDVTAAGYPYAGMLGGLNITRGSVSSLKGLGGDPVTMQITSPIQSGNSGGPLLASDGEVVGVVVSKLNELKVADALGDVPQNVNFAIRGEVALLFLAQNGVEAKLSLDDRRLEPEELAELATSFTTFIECR
ncbi:S1C family serine protease [Ruegeria arenilitoris]|uniref:S1C family serine protease n=1 Tax=Ruegeria arenilitoris TaxID=1173585 RepID=UPI00147D4527|nr:serine protease [Ruegeria arenilitoris]